MTGSAALPELIVVTVAQLLQEMRTVETVRAGSQRRATMRKFQHSRLEMERLR